MTLGMAAVMMAMVMVTTMLTDRMSSMILRGAEGDGWELGSSEPSDRKEQHNINHHFKWSFHGWSFTVHHNPFRPLNVTRL
jgi:hypothetical protein